jgi:excisionase family DNA binding protein
MPYLVPMHKTTHEALALITTADAAKVLGVHVATISRMVAAGRLVPAVKVPGKRGAFLFHPEDVEALRTT